MVSDAIRGVANRDIQTALNLAGWVFFSLLMGLWHHLIFVSQKKAKLWEPKQNSVREAINALKISFCSDLVGLGFIVIALVLGYSLFGLSKSNDAELVAGIAGLAMIFSWMITTPILYQQELNKELRSAVKKPQKKKPVTVKPKSKFKPK
jgi:hypothetical protein